MDTESGLYNFNARLYDPTLGRFISPDPAVPDLSDPTNPRNFDPQILNRYSYCRNNPMIYIDPSGLEEVESSSASSSIGDDSKNDGGGDRSGWGCDTSGFDGATGLVVIGPDGITIVGPGNKKNNNLRYAQVDWPSLNAFLMGSRPRGLFVCDRPVHGLLGLVGYNHAYGFSYVSMPNSYGMDKTRVHDVEIGPSQNYLGCGCIKGSIGKEQSIMNALMVTADEGPWIGFFHDCHSALERALRTQGFIFVGTPNGRWSGNFDAR
jgi:RHS repeat-associated protein